MKISNLALAAFVVLLAGTSLSAREFGGGGGRGEEGGFRNSAEFHNDVNAGGRPGTYREYPAGRGNAYEAGYNQGSYNSNAGAGTGTNVYIQQQPSGPQINPNQMPY